MDDRVLTLTPEVINALNQELAYQADRVAAGRTDGVHYGTPGQIVTLQTYARHASAAWVQNPGNNAALHELRKCAAIAIRALLTEGCPKRVSGGGGHVTGQDNVPIGPGSWRT